MLLVEASVPVVRIRRSYYALDTTGALPLVWRGIASVYGTEGCWFEPSGVYSFEQYSGFRRKTTEAPQKWHLVQSKVRPAEQGSGAS